MDQNMGVSTQRSSNGENNIKFELDALSKITKVPKCNLGQLSTKKNSLDLRILQNHIMTIIIG